MKSSLGLVNFLIAGGPYMLLFFGRRCILGHYPYQLVGNIGFFQIRTFFRRQGKLHRFGSALNMVQLGGAHYG